MSAEVLSLRAINRAMLSRQLLLCSAMRRYAATCSERSVMRTLHDPGNAEDLLIEGKVCLINR